MIFYAAGSSSAGASAAGSAAGAAGAASLAAELPPQAVSENAITPASNIDTTRLIFIIDLLNK
jgi:hypothetical protein